VKPDFEARAAELRTRQKALQREERHQRFLERTAEKRELLFLQSRERQAQRELASMFREVSSGLLVSKVTVKKELRPHYDTVRSWLENRPPRVVFPTKSTVDASDFISLSVPSCGLCAGRGWVMGLKRLDKGEFVGRLCNCVLRQAFISALKKYERLGYIQRDSRTFCVLRGRTYGRPVEDYRADFLWSLKRLGDTAFNTLRIFYMEGAGWQGVSKFLIMDKGNTFHNIYSAAEAAGEELLRAGLVR